MGVERIPDTDIQYVLKNFDSDGSERTESGGRASQLAIHRAETGSVTDIFFFCHGWKGDLPAARDQYGQWIGAFAASEDRRQAPRRLGKFRPLFIGLHWRSLPFGTLARTAGCCSSSGGHRLGAANKLEYGKPTQKHRSYSKQWLIR